MPSFIPKPRSCPVLVRLAWLAGLALQPCIAAAQASGWPNAQASDPARMGWMVGSPPPGRTVRFDDGSYFRFPAMRWSICHFRELMPTTQVSRGLGAPVLLPRA